MTYYLRFKRTLPNEIFNFIGKLLFIFGFLYDINFTFLPSFTSARLAFLFLLLLFLKKNHGISKNALYYILVLFFVFSIALIQFVLVPDSTQLSRILWFSIYGVISPFLFVNFLKSRNEFLILVSVAAAIQAVLSIFSFINPSVKALFYNLVIFTSNFEEDQVLRAVAFASIGGAGLSVIQSLGVISSIALLKINNFGIYRTILIWLMMAITVVSIFLIGRTGLFISLLCIFIYFISEIKSLKKIIVISLVILGIYQINTIDILENLTSNVDGFSVDMFTAWIENAFNIENNDTSEALASMPIPPVTFQTIIGTGRVVHESGVGNASMHDSGYIQTYYSLGLLTAIYFYISYIIFLIFQVGKGKSGYLYFLILLMFIIEIKEPFIFQYVFPFFVLSMILISDKIEFKEESENKSKLNINLS
ncbi:hypothetical protein SAMN05444338_104136 [Flavobacterium degerlachei]|uniref:O-Antigen ligase n=1 Tax=Flavobacterium degerlachei TaxID=229203 RepID=A0A1H2VQF0_9FLAO|nr:hypothetical protein SAMN05444338_104136 [Flavobacterium degerlachei]